MRVTERCAACGKTFTGTSVELRAVIWPHAETHALEDFPSDGDGGRVQFTSEFVLSCNCGACEFCRRKLLS